MPNRVKCRGSSPELPFEVGRGGHVANSNLGNGNLRPETFGRTRQELPLRIAGPPTETDPWPASYGNVVLPCGVGNHVDLRGLPGGAEGIRTDSHRGRSESSYSSLRRSMGAACSRRAPSRSRSSPRLAIA